MKWIFWISIQKKLQFFKVKPLFLVLFVVLVGLQEDEGDEVGRDGQHVDNVQPALQEPPLVRRSYESECRLCLINGIYRLTFYGIIINNKDLCFLHDSIGQTQFSDLSSKVWFAVYQQNSYNSSNTQEILTYIYNSSDCRTAWSRIKTRNRFWTAGQNGRYIIHLILFMFFLYTFDLEKACDVHLS